MKLNEKKRNKKCMFWISAEERKLINAKADYYGYTSMSEYIRDAAIYEKVKYINIKNRDEIYNAFALYSKELNKIIKQIRYISKYATQINQIDVNKLLSFGYEIRKINKQMLNVIRDKMDFDVWQQINR